ncbi:MAG TPA: hypothetical protein PK018_17155 [Candidatus Competibacter sp.]|mgnify:CR=1 FL=1|nr:hypothetical protein [Candidatus Competibacteraceae bacterium]HPE73870.1 hypothetical protein [Candidatus Competibacter sp.]HRW67649.1 hypothetical protein [Candidatus Competibacter sp.]
MKQGVLIRLASLLLVGVVALLPACTADAQGDASKYPPDLSDVAQGTYFGDVISDSQGSSQSGVTVIVTRIGKNRVQITADYARLPRVDVALTQAMDKILNASGATTFLLDRSQVPMWLDISFRNEVSWSGAKQ